MDYLSSVSSKFKGYRTSSTQPLDWPRVDVWDISYRGAMVESNEIPVELKSAQCALAIDASERPLLESRRAGDPGAIISESVNGASASYSEDKSKNSSRFALADVFLKKLFRVALVSVRV